MARKRIFHVFILFLVLCTTAYSVVNSAQQIGAKEEASGEVACSIVVAMCALDSDAGICSTAAHRQCDAMQPSPLTTLVHSGTEATFFLTVSLLIAGYLALVLTENFCTVFLEKTALLARNFFNVHGACRTCLLAGEFSSLRF